ncbi:transcriptional regulator [Niastella vici]|uniref:Transcriptional regulator n=1 Tax=Niastella vici TaxID=1703345 RepID=A0A1V9FNE6_9BACT|nr:helix-turn-helix transcriptional regulator [Niastella vici]OQP59884.1 transcriptional regulator [Niastella vici]
MEDQFKKMAGLIGEPVRAAIMWALLDGKALTATELTIVTGTTAPNLSMHIARLVQADLLSVETQGRHRYYKFSRKEIAYAIEAMANLIPPGSTTTISTNDNNSAIRNCRTCYDHLAGKVGVALTDSLLREGIITENGKTFELTPKGGTVFSDLGMNIDEIKKKRRSFLRPCLDWSERRYHIAGALAAALLEHMIASDWIRRQKNSRAITITSKGQREFYRYFKLNTE